MLGRFEAPWFYIPPFPFPKECTKLTSGLTKKELDIIETEKACKSLEPYESHVFGLLDRLNVKGLLSKVNHQILNGLGEIEPKRTLTAEKMNKYTYPKDKQNVLSKGWMLKFEYDFPQPIWKEFHDVKRVSGITQTTNFTELHIVIARRGPLEKSCGDGIDGHGFFLRFGTKEDLQKFSEGNGGPKHPYGYRIELQNGMYLTEKVEATLGKFLQEFISKEFTRRKENLELPTDISKQILHVEKMIEQAMREKRKFYHAEFSWRGDLSWNHV